MAQFSATTEGEETLNVNPETLVAVLAATNLRPVLIEWGVSFKGTTSTDSPILVRLYQITTSGTSTGGTEAKWSRASGAAQCTSFNSFTAEPTKGDILAEYEVHPQAGSLVVQYPLGREPVIGDNSASQGLAIVVATALSTLTAVAYMVWEE